MTNNPDQSGDDRNDTLFYFAAASIPIGIVVVVFLVFGILWAANQPLQYAAPFGDSFGFVNALFSGLAFAGVITAILIQARELRQAFEEQQDAREAHQAVAQLQQRSSIIDAISTLAVLNERVVRPLETIDISACHPTQVSRIVRDFEHRRLLQKIIDSLKHHDTIKEYNLPLISEPDLECLGCRAMMTLLEQINVQQHFLMKCSATELTNCCLEFAFRAASKLDQVNFEDIYLLNFVYFDQISKKLVQFRDKDWLETKQDSFGRPDKDLSLQKMTAPVSFREFLLDEMQELKSLTVRCILFVALEHSGFNPGGSPTD
ncbi:hypothetical protein [Planctomycetes bacterium TBK1r]|uniref:Uncharacterized protein n=1 Tax=Stieleria magnilauensis TaxID=2527963 RepID=A0ABX5XYQ1_9BACT|nr:hypothetical protein TBK1r_61970 [Planctomycetes bacterium TBK1r]